VPALGNGVAYAARVSSEMEVTNAGMTPFHSGRETHLPQILGTAGKVLQHDSSLQPPCFCGWEELCCACIGHPAGVGVSRPTRFAKAQWSFAISQANADMVTTINRIR
jgi:hypothetical protein